MHSIFRQSLISTCVLTPIAVFPTFYKGGPLGRFVNIIIEPLERKTSNIKIFIEIEYPLVYECGPPG